MAAEAVAPGTRLVRERGPVSSALYQIARFALHKPLGMFGAVMMVALVVVAIFAPVVAPAPPLEHSTAVLQSPSTDHPAGTDQFGRDTLSRVIYGARISLYVGVFATVGAMIPSVAFGIAGAFFGGWFDYFWGRFVDTIQALPGLLLLIAIMVILGPSLLNVVIALTFSRAIVGSRVMRGATLSVMNEVYVDAARAVGATNLRIMMRHLLPNIVPTIIVVNTLAFGAVILAEASLSFLGYGVPPPQPSWGGMLAADGRAYMFAAPWMFWAPTIALALVVFGVNMFGDAIRDVLDPRLRGTG